MRIAAVALGALSLLLPGARAADAPKKIVLIAGTKSHGPGDHEYEKGVRLLKHGLDTAPNLKGFTTEVHLDGWPKDDRAFDGAATVLLYSDGSDRDEQAHPLLREKRLQTMRVLLERGVGLVAVHYSVFVPRARAGDLFLDGLGGYFDYESGPKPRGWFSKIQTCVGKLTLPSPQHPVSRGLTPFDLREEFYYNMRLRPKERGGVVPILHAALPHEKDEQVVAWAVERPGGGRGFGYTGGHFHKNWRDENVRRMLLNALVWTAGGDVPQGGVRSTLPEEERPYRVLVVTGHQHPAHDWKTTTKALQDVLGGDSRAELTVVEDPEFLAKKELDRYDVLVLNYQNHERAGLTVQARDGLMRFVESGKGLVVVHFANGAFADWPDYRRLARRVWVDKVSGHDAFGTFVVEIADKGHPITKGLQEYETTDELYFKQQGNLPVDVLLTARSKVTGQREPMAFVYKQGKGHVFQTVLGHDAVAIRNGGTAEVIRRGTAWAAGRVPMMTPPVTPKPPTTPLREGKFGSALDGRARHAEAKHHAAYQSPPLTVECWAKLDAARGFNLLVANNVKESKTHWEIYSVAGSGTFSAYLPGFTPDVNDSGARITDGKWHHLAMALEAERVRLFVDGKQVRDARLTPRPGGTARDGALWFGAYPPGALGCDGLVDEVRIRKGAHPIGRIPDKPLTAEADTLGLWRFDGVDGGRVADEGTLRNFAALSDAAASLSRERGPSSATELDYQPADPRLKVVLIDRSLDESFVAIKADTQGRLFVGGREALFVYEPDALGGYHARRELFRFPPDAWIAGIEIRQDDLYVMTASALYRFVGGRTKRDGLTPERLVWGLPLDLHVSYHCLAWGPEGDLYFNHGDPLLGYGDFSRPDHWGHWTVYGPNGEKTPYTGTGAVCRVRPDGSNFRVVATGLRGPFGLTFDRHWNLFTNDNDHESRPDLYTPGRLLHVTQGIDFGWPRGWIASKVPERSDLVEAMHNVPGRGVPVGMCYYDDPFLPELRHSLLQARWDTLAVTRQTIEPRGASYRSQEAPFLVGKVRARPVGVAVGRGGRVFVAVSYMAGNEASPHYVSDLAMVTRADDAPNHPFESYDVTKLTEAQLRDEQAHPSWERRREAHLETLRRGGSPPPPLRDRLRDLGALFKATESLPFEDVATAAASDDSYLRQTGATLLARRATFEQIAALTHRANATQRLAGVLAAGFRLTVPRPDAPPPADVPLFYPKGNAFFQTKIRFGDAPTTEVELSPLGRVGAYTTAEMWRAVKPTIEQQQLFQLLIERLKDAAEPVRLQSAYFLSLLKDSRAEPLVAAVQREARERRFAGATPRPVVRAWVVGPFAAGEGTVEGTAIDLTAEYATRRGPVAWRQAMGDRLALPSGGESYVYFQLQSRVRQPARVDVGAATRAWHNGRPVPVADGAVFLDVQPGSNDVLVRVAGETLALSCRALQDVVPSLPDKLGTGLLAQRLREASSAKQDAVPAEFLAFDWPAEAKKGNVAEGRKLFGSLACAKCHAIAPDQPGGGAPSLVDAGKRFTVAHLVEAILLPSRQVAEPFRTTTLTTQQGVTLAGLVVGETAEAVELLLPDATRKTVRVKDIEERRKAEASPMPAGVVKTAAELRDLLAYLLSERPTPP